MNKITKEKFLKNLEVVHVQRLKDNFLDPSILGEDAYWYERYNKDRIETTLKYKGASVVKVYTMLTKGYYNQKNVRIDVETNRKFVKKHNLPYKKTKVFGDDKDDTFNNEIQLQLGVSFVRKLMYEIIKEVEDKFDYKVENIVSTRCNGIYMNSNKDNKEERTCRIKLLKDDVVV